jgi:hypothetical protein
MPYASIWFLMAQSSRLYNAITLGLARCNEIEKLLLGEKQDRNAEGRLVLGKGADETLRWCIEHGITYKPKNTI